MGKEKATTWILWVGMRRWPLVVVAVVTGVRESTPIDGNRLQK